MGTYRVEISAGATAYVEVEVDGDPDSEGVKAVVIAEALNKAANEIHLCYQCSGGDGELTGYTLELGEFDTVEKVTQIGA